MGNNYPGYANFLTMAQSKTLSSMEFTVCGQRIPVKASQVDPELLAELERLVGNKLKDAERRAARLAPHQVVLLALVDLANDYVQARRKTSEFKRSVTEKSGEIIATLERKLSLPS